IPPTDEGELKWRESGTDAGPASIDDGRANTNLIPNEARFPAFKACKDLRFGGYSDWYLPAQGELFHLFAVRPQLEVKENIANFTTDYYWSSTQLLTSHAWTQGVTNGSQYNGTKSGARAVRCVRR
ncbi:MAG TPA: DUF1566 domain-containing protein, partial [Chthoniobacteraceae bacterium]|nr:DUF1566 domain-containing protein [Chthoniobacteraceae bacterium]